MGAGKKTIEFSRFYPYPRELVWQAITDRKALSQWLMETDFEPVVGRKFQFRAKPVKGWRGYVDCQVLEVTAPQRLVYSWQGMPEHHVTTVTYELIAQGDGTLLTGRHEGFDQSHGWLSGMMLRAMLGAGWKKMLRKLLPQVLHNLSSPGGEKTVVDDVRC